MPGSSRPCHDPTDAWDQLRQLVTSPEQAIYELLRPIVLYGHPAAARPCETRVTEPRFLASGYASPQPFLAPLEDVVWHPAQRLTPYRVRRGRCGQDRQARLFTDEGGVAVG